jgi:hypothetical protein
VDAFVLRGADGAVVAAVAATSCEIGQWAGRSLRWWASDDAPDLALQAACQVSALYSHPLSAPAVDGPADERIAAAIGMLNVKGQGWVRRW